MKAQRNETDNFLEIQKQTIITDKRRATRNELRCADNAYGKRKCMFDEWDEWLLTHICGVFLIMLSCELRDSGSKFFDGIYTTG